MKHLKTYQLFEAQSVLTADQEAFLNECTDGTWSYNPATGLVDVEGGFDCAAKDLEGFVGVKFGKVSGDFHCHDNKLTSLSGAPKEVGGSFDCRNNSLTTLAGAPLEVGRSFYCRNNSLTTLSGAPQKVGRSFYCDAFGLERGEWNLRGWLKVLEEGSPEAQSLISTILPAEELNKEIQKDPAGMIMKLKDIWNDEGFKETRSKLVWPKGYEQEADLVGDLDDVGF